MAERELPRFRYHPDPLATGSIVESAESCDVCGEPRGFLYDGPVYGAVYSDERICAWCIADGTAAARFDAEFTDAGAPELAGLPREVLEELAYRTPGFTAIQQEHWLAHCDDAAAFFGYGEEDPAEYRFRCLHCGRDLAYSDSD